MKLSERAMLTKLSIGVWSGRTHDRDVTEEVSESHKADLRDAGSYSKQLISKKFMSHVGSVARTARSKHRILTLPWNDDGTRILTCMGHEHYTQQMRLSRQGFEAAVSNFCKNIPFYTQEAKQRLGTMFNSEDYPTADDIKGKFSIDVEISPIPEGGDFRAELSDASVKAIVKDIERRSDERIKMAMNDVFERILDATSKMTERLKAFKPSVGDEPAENVFRDSLVWNINELADLLPSLNVTGDKRLDDLQKLLKEQLVEHSPDILREDEKLRRQVAERAEKLHRKVKAYLG